MTQLFASMVVAAVCAFGALLASSIAVAELGYRDVLPRASHWLLLGEQLDRPVSARERRARIALMLAAMLPLSLFAPVGVLVSLATPTPRWLDLPGAMLATSVYGVWLFVVLRRIRRVRARE